MKLKNYWDTVLNEEFNSKYFAELLTFVKQESREKKIFPQEEDILNALKLTDYHDVKVVILGQDPYHNEGEAHGLSFSVESDAKIPPSLRNIFKELKSDLNIERTNCNLSDWAKQGVLLLNTVLTVEKNKPNSHRDKGWEIFTDAVIKSLNYKEHPVVFLLWGNNAKQKRRLIDSDKHLIVESAHPSPFSYSRGFKGSRPFSIANEFLSKNHMAQIKWGNEK